MYKTQNKIQFRGNFLISYESTGHYQRKLHLNKGKYNSKGFDGS